MVNKDFNFKALVEQFPGYGGWVYVAVPKKYTKELKEKRMAWGMYPITACVGKTKWSTKLMMKKGGDFFVALKADIRKKENIGVGDYIQLEFSLSQSKKSS